MDEGEHLFRGRVDGEGTVESWVEYEAGYGGFVDFIGVLVFGETVAGSNSEAACNSVTEMS